MILSGIMHIMHSSQKYLCQNGEDWTWLHKKYAPPIKYKKVPNANTRCVKMCWVGRQNQKIANTKTFWCILFTCSAEQVEQKICSWSHAWLMSCKLTWKYSFSCIFVFFVFFFKSLWPWHKCNMSRMMHFLVISNWLACSHLFQHAVKNLWKTQPIFSWKYSFFNHFF